MAITPDQYHLLIAAPMLQNYLVDKDTGFPLAGGWVTFYHDTDRQRLKNVYTQTGTPGNYTYIELANPMQLSSVGTMTDSYGNDIIPYYFPYDEEDSNELDTYYVVVQANTPNNTPGVEQFTREDFPFIDADDNPDFNQLDLINLIPNGQFSAHNNLPNSGLFPNGDSSFTVAQGGSIGWYFTKNNTSTDLDTIIFDQLTQEPPNVTGNPRFAINITCSSTSGNDTFKELRMRFNNVNRFASDENIYTFSFTGKSNTASSANVFLKLIKNFGTGGSATLTTTLEGFTLDSGLYDIKSFSFIFGTNEGSTIGPDNDDYMELSIAFPSNQTFSISLTDFILISGAIDISQYPERPDNMVYADGIVGSIPTPDPDGFDIGLPIILARAGVGFDHSVVGNIIASPSASLSNHLLCDGSTYSSFGYSSTGVPYRRLQQFLISPAPEESPLYGTGSTFATAYFVNGLTNVIRLTTNQPGAQAGAADGIAPHATGFTFANIHTGQASTVRGFSAQTISVDVIGTSVGTVTAPTVGTTTFGIAPINTAAGGTLPQYYAFVISAVAGASITGGQYFTFHANPGNAEFYVWFTVNGVGADPAPGGTGYQVNVLSTDTAAEISRVVKESISGSQVSRIACNAASTLTGGDYWTFDANGTTYAILYIINGVGDIPAGVDETLAITLVGTETAEEVTALTVSVINNRMFAVPDLRGVYLVGNRGSGQYDTNAVLRFSPISGYTGNNVGTFQNALAYSNDATSSASQRGSEFNNASINWFIRY